jgi:hypothetical protein
MVGLPNHGIFYCIEVIECGYKLLGRIAQAQDAERQSQQKN